MAPVLPPRGWLPRFMLSGSALAQTPEPVMGGSSRMSLADQDVQSFDPPAPVDNMSIWTMLLIYDQLVRVDADGTAIEPGLAESWSANDDGHRYTFKLRDANFHDGTPVTADDVAFSLMRAKNYEGGRVGFIFSAIESVDAPDRQDRGHQSVAAVGAVRSGPGAVLRLDHLRRPLVERRATISSRTRSAPAPSCSTPGKRTGDRAREESGLLGHRQAVSR